MPFHLSETTGGFSVVDRYRPIETKTGSVALCERMKSWLRFLNWKEVTRNEDYRNDRTVVPVVQAVPPEEELVLHSGMSRILQIKQSV